MQTEEDVCQAVPPDNEVLTMRGFSEMAASGFLGEISHVREADRKKKVRNDLGDKEGGEEDDEMTVPDDGIHAVVFSLLTEPIIAPYRRIPLSLSRLSFLILILLVCLS